MTAKQATFIASCWIVVFAAFFTIYLTERGLLCGIAMVVLSVGVVAAVIATALSDGNRDSLQTE